MAINYTPTSPIIARLTTHEGYSEALEEYEVTMVAFGWADAEPEKSTGIWVLGAKAGGATFIPANAIQRLEPWTPKVDAALTRTHDTAVRALDLASELRIMLAKATGELQGAGKAGDGRARSAARRPAASKTASRASSRRGAKAKA